ncbi:MAG TPA: fibronectin/fibrinogen-binding protein [Clostridiales bacterium]|jgi:predicted ribosome quality control (RQC) complex YloA/Tae2 family protein|nr:fibronectin/fibrinogen-binding protein [Clostridiales bacterium]
MPLDALCLMPLTEEIRKAAEGARIDKIQQPGKNELVFSIRGPLGAKRLFISAASGRARAHFTELAFENPKTPPMFCMLLRKHLAGAKICTVTQPPMERMLAIEIDSYDEMGVETKKRLYVELISNSANVVLAGGDGRIIDCLRRVEGDEKGEKRRLLPGLFYKMPPPTNKHNLLLLTEEEICSLWRKANPGKTVDAWLLESFSGLSPLVCRELSQRFFGDIGLLIGGLPAGENRALPQKLWDFVLSIKAGNLKPHMLSDAGKPFDFSCMPITQYGNKMEISTFESFSGMLDAFYSKRESEESARQRTQVLMKTVKTLRDRRAKKLANQKEELKATYGRERLREIGDILMANLHNLKKGLSSVRLNDFYSEDSGEIEIKLDPLLTPQQNAAKYYKEYTKKKNAERHLTEQIEIGESELMYLESVLDELSRAASERDVAEIRQELQRMGYIRAKSGGKKEKEVKSKPLRFVSSSGFQVLVGKNNSQNDELTFKTAERFDLWLHTQRVHGSHVVVSLKGREVDDRTLEEAAILAAYFSQASQGQKIPVDYTLIKNVKKPPHAKPGMVIYTDYKTIFVTPDEKVVQALKAD